MSSSSLWRQVIATECRKTVVVNRLFVLFYDNLCYLLFQSHKELYQIINRWRDAFLSLICFNLTAKNVVLSDIKKVKVKVTLVQALRLCTGRTAHRASRGIALLFHDHFTRREWGVSVTLRPLFTPGKDPVPIVQGVGWAPRPVWTGTENLKPGPSST